MTHLIEVKIILKCVVWGFPDGSVVKNAPTSAGDAALILDPRVFNVPWSQQARVPQLLSLRSRTQEPQLLKPVRTRALAPKQEKPQ